MTKYCPYCNASVKFPDKFEATTTDPMDAVNQRMQKLGEKLVRCPNPICGKYLVKSECKDQP
jgi:hypothetical protein